MSAGGFGYVVGDHGPDKVAAGGAVAFAASLGDRLVDAQKHIAHCPACSLLARPFACTGLIETPLSARGEEWLVERLPTEIESVGGFLLRKAIGDYGYDGARARDLRAAGRLAATGAFERHYGPFFRRFVVSSDQIVEELLCAGDISPAHALAVLMHLQALDVDGVVPTRMEDGDKLGALVSSPSERKTRCRFNIAASDGDDATVTALKGLLAALYAGFILDTDVFVLDSEERAQPGDTP